MDILDLPGWRLLAAPLDGEGYRLAEPDTCQQIDGKPRRP